MKTYMDRLREAPVEVLRNTISRQKGEIMIMQRDLELMEQALREKTEEKVSETTCKTQG